MINLILTLSKTILDEKNYIFIPYNLFLNKNCSNNDNVLTAPRRHLAWWQSEPKLSITIPMLESQTHNPFGHNAPYIKLHLYLHLFKIFQNHISITMLHIHDLF